MARSIVGTLSLIALCFGSLAATAKSNVSDDVDRYVRAEMAKQKIPGLSLVVVRNGAIVKAAGYGLANVEHNVPVTPETVFQSGSLGKQFTAAAVMLLVEEGKLALDSPIKTYLPKVPSTWNRITVRHLLNHTSGIKNYDDDDLDFRKDYTEGELLAIASKFPLDFPPGEKWNYSNTGYIVLGILIGKVTGKFYGDFLKERIFDPLGMSTSRIISEADIIPNRAAGYRLVNGALKNQEWVSPSLNTTADGSLYLTVLDFAKWDAALSTEKLLSERSRTLLWTPTVLANGKKRQYGFGWSLYAVRGHRSVEHSGAWQGFSTYITRYLDDGLTVVVLTNLEFPHSDPARIAHRVAGLYEPALARSLYPPIEDTDPETTTFARRAFEQVLAGKPDPAAFSAEMRVNLKTGGLAVVQEQLATYGSLLRFHPVERAATDEPRTSRYEAEFDEQSVYVLVTLTDERKIAALSITDN